MIMDLGNSILLAFAILGFVIVIKGVTQVPQSEEWVVERLGKYNQTLKAGFHFIIPVIDAIPRPRNRVHILETSIEEPELNIITKDNVQIMLHAVVFYRTIDAAKSIYRIDNVKNAIKTTTISVTRATCGQMEFDEIQAHREVISDKIKTSLLSACEVWGVDITRAEVLDVRVDQRTTEAMQSQLNAERTRRATVLVAEGERASANLVADGQLYKAQKEAEALRISADAEAYAKRTQADAEAYATARIAEAINQNGQAAVNFELAKLQTEAMTRVAQSNGAKLIILPTDTTRSLGALAAMVETLKG